MTPEELIKTIYLGDRGCLGIDIHFSGRIIKLHIDSISRVRSPRGCWENYVGEDIENGYIVFSGVKSYSIAPLGAFADDFIDNFTIKNTEYDSSGVIIYTFSFEVGYSTNIATIENTTTYTPKTMEIEIKARELWLEDPRKPYIKIVD